MPTNENVKISALTPVNMDGEQSPAQSLTPENLATVPPQKDVKIGHYVRNGEVFVFIDSLDVNFIWSSSAKNVAYNYRFIINMPNAGIMPYGGPHAITTQEDPAPLIKTRQPLYRAEFKLS
jgi:hypothetical protein